MDERKIEVTAGSVLVTATLNDSSTAEALLERAAVGSVGEYLGR